MENKLSLYQITEQMAQVEKAIYDTIDEETGEVNGDLTAIYKELQLAEKDKLNGYRFVVEKNEDNIELAKKKIIQLKNFVDKSEKLIERIKKALNDNLEVGKKYELEDGHSIGWKKSESVEITDLSKLPKKYIKTKIEESPDKIKIKADIKAGKKVKGAELVGNMNIQIK